MVRDANGCQELTIQKDTQVWELRCCKEEHQRQTDLALHSHNQWKDKEHAAVVTKAKAHDQEAMPPPAIPPHVPLTEKTLTMMMPQLSMPSVPVSICHQEAMLPRTSMSSEGPRHIGTSSSSPSPTKVVDSLDSTDVIDQLAQYRKYYLPDEGPDDVPDEVEMEEPDDDSHAIAEMELEYLGVASTQEDWHQGEYGDVPMYHTIPSPQGANEDDDGMLEGSTAEVSPETEAALLQVDDAAGNQSTRQAVAPEQQPSITKD